MRRIAALILCASLLIGASEPASKPAPAFSILGASVNLKVVRKGADLPATLVPNLNPGDEIDISFPNGVQFSTSPRWHLVVADMYDDYLQHTPDFPIPDATLSRAKPGFVWKVAVKASTTPLIFLVPESGSRYGHGIPDARAAITNLKNRALLLKTAALSASAQAKQSTLDIFLHSLSSVHPGTLPDGHARIANATNNLFGYDLADQACFSSSVATSTQYACAAQAMANGYDASPKVGVGTAIVDQLSVNTATYGMLIGALYVLLAKRRVDAHYTFVPGVLRAGSRSTDVYVNEQPEYDPSASKPSSIVYVQIGAKSAGPGYGSAPDLPSCIAGDGLSEPLPFTGLPVYFRSHEMQIHAGSQRFNVPAQYDPLTGYHATLSKDQIAALSSGGTATIASTWGFDRYVSPQFSIIEAQPTTWNLESDDGSNDSSNVIAGTGNASLIFDDGNAHMGPCVTAISLTDGLGHTIPVSDFHREQDTVTATLDATTAFGPTGSATVTENDAIASTPVPFPVLPAMPAVTSAVVYLPKGMLVLHGTGLKYIDSATLERTGLTFGSGQPNTDGSWSFSLTGKSHPAYDAMWEHEAMAISFTLEPPDTRTAAVPADVEFAR